MSTSTGFSIPTVAVFATPFHSCNYHRPRPASTKASLFPLSLTWLDVICVCINKNPASNYATPPLLLPRRLLHNQCHDFFTSPVSYSNYGLWFRILTLGLQICIVLCTSMHEQRIDLCSACSSKGTTTLALLEPPRCSSILVDPCSSVLRPPRRFRMLK